MSNIYIQEPPTNGKVLLKTSVGDIDIELWSKEAPLACRNFVQLCLEGYYNDNIFHRLVKGFIVQSGDPSGTGLGGESIYGKPFKDEFHSRLRFVRRGLVALANDGSADDNSSQFFFTLESCPELQNKHTIFGKVTGKTLYNLLRLGEGEVDQNERPVYPQKILSAEVLSNPFPDIVPRVKKVAKKEKTKEQKARENIKANKNFALLSFGDEAEEEEEEINRVSSEYRGKSKSSHDLLKNDTKLSSIPAIDREELNEDKDDEPFENNNQEEDDSASKRKQRLSKVKEKLNVANKFKREVEDEEEIELFFEDERMQKKNKDIENAKEEFKKLKKQMLLDMKKEKDVDNLKIKEKDSAAIEFAEETKKFKETAEKIPKKGQGREEMCLDLLQKFKNRLQSGKEKQSNNEEVKDYKSAWLTHTMQCAGDDEIVLAKDANERRNEDWYDIYDPRNPMNKRRREGA